MCYRVQLFAGNAISKQHFGRDDRSQQDGFSGAGTANDAQHLAAINIEIEVIMNDRISKRIHQATDADDGFRLIAHSR